MTNNMVNRYIAALFVLFHIVFNSHSSIFIKSPPIESDHYMTDMSQSHVTSSFLPGPECLLSPSVTHDSSVQITETRRHHTTSALGAQVTRERCNTSLDIFPFLALGESCSVSQSQVTCSAAPTTLMPGKSH